MVPLMPGRDDPLLLVYLSERALCQTLTNLHGETAHPSGSFSMSSRFGQSKAYRRRRLIRWDGPAPLRRRARRRAARVNRTSLRAIDPERMRRLFETVFLARSASFD